MMITKKITSLQHPLVLEWVRLRQEKEARQKANKVLIMGKKMGSEVTIETLIATEEDPKILAKDTYIVTDAILKKVTGLYRYLSPRERSPSESE